MLYACSGNAVKKNGGVITIRHVVFFVVANTHIEALGKAVLLTLEAYPKKDGWANHDTVITRDNEKPVEPGSGCIYVELN